MTARRPTTLRLGPLTFSVEYSDDMEDLGTMSGPRALIKVSTDQAESVQRETLLHELMHAVMFVSGATKLVGSDEREERLIRAISPWLLGVLRDNPQLLRYLLEGSSVRAAT